MIKIPQHIAIIMDGNRRWARKRGLQIIRGHRKVALELIEELADYCLLKNISYLTLWAFSTENWKRSHQEVKLLMDLFREMLADNIEKLHNKGIKIEVIGDISRFEPDIQTQVKEGLEKTKNNEKLVLTFGLNYGGRDELVRSVKKISEKAINDEIKIAEIDEVLISQQLDTANLPDPDLIIRPGGEKRLSGFMPWQSVYSELYFSDVLMPDFNSQELEKALEDFAARQRRFGS